MGEFTSYKAGTPCWVDVTAPDIDAVRAFYRGLFGWEVQSLGPEASGYAMFTLRGKVIAGSSAPMSPEPTPPTWMTYVKVDNADETAQKVSANGGTVVFPPSDVMEAGRMSVFVDPTGVPIAIWQPGNHIGASLANEPGTFTWNELQTRDVMKAAAFYKAVFGWADKTEDYGGTPSTTWMVEDGPVGGMMPISPMVPAEVPGFWLVYFTVVGTDATVAKALELGGNVLTPAFDAPVGRMAVLQDPSGAAFAVIRPTG